MTAFFDRAGSTAKRLLSKYGKTLTLVRKVNSGYDPVTGVTSSTTSHTVSGQIFDYSDWRIANSNGLIQTGDRRILIAATDIAFDPDPTTDQIVLAGNNWSIISVKKPVDEDVVIELQVRRV